jgi:predicted DNA-binding antitoxin AbrB/MazE fold protein
MTLTVAATYENGTLKLAEPLPLLEHEKVEVTVRRVGSIAEQTYGMIGWSGDADTFKRILEESELELLD